MSSPSPEKSIEQQIEEAAEERVELEKDQLSKMIDGVPLPDCIPDMVSLPLGRASLVASWLSALSEDVADLIEIVSPHAVRVVREEMAKGLPKDIWNHAKFITDTWDYIAQSTFSSQYNAVIVANQKNNSRLVSAIKFRPEIEQRWEINRKKSKKDQEIVLFDS